MNSISKKDLLVATQRGAINVYKGKHGLVNFSLLDSVKFHEVGSMRFYSAIDSNDPNHIIIGVTGSNDMFDWFYNIAFFPARNPLWAKKKSLKYHGGDLKLHSMVMNRILNLVKTFPRVTIYGHSMGASVGQLVAQSVSYYSQRVWKTKKNLLCIAFSPNPVFATTDAQHEFNRWVPNNVSVYIKGDIVTKSPWFYKHATNQIILNSDDLPIRESLFKSFDAHRPLNVYKKLEQADLVKFLFIPT